MALFWRQGRLRATKKHPRLGDDRGAVAHESRVANPREEDEHDDELTDMAHDTYDSVGR